MDAPGAWVLSVLGAGRRSYCLYRVSEVIHICCFRFFLFIAAYGNVYRIIKRHDALFDSGYVLAVYKKRGFAYYKKNSSVVAAAYTAGASWISELL